MDNFEVITPNARLIYQVMENPPLKWQAGLDEIEQFLSTRARLERANEEVYLYFFLPADHPDFLTDDCWVAIEIIGVPTFDPNSPLKTMDLDHSRCLEFSVDFQSFGDLFLAEARKRKDAQKWSKSPLALTWRLKLNFSSERQNITAFIQFFYEAK